MRLLPLIFATLLLFGTAQADLAEGPGYELKGKKTYNRSCTVYEVDRDTVTSRYRAKAVATTRSRAESRACSRAMKECNERKFRGNYCIEKSDYRDDGDYEFVEFVFDLIFATIGEALDD